VPEPAVVRIENGQFLENCYLLADEQAGEAVMIDPGEEPARFLEELERRGWTLRAIWLTHAHLDHIAGVDVVRRATGARVWLHPGDARLYAGLPQQGAWFGLALDPLDPPDEELADRMRLAVGAHAFEVRHVPGHSRGSVCFVGEGLVVGGDVLFAGSIGRTDLPGGDFFTLLRSIHRELLPLPDQTALLPGHGPPTTIGAERRTNPFLTGGAAGAR